MGRGQPVKTLGRYRDQQVVFGREMTVGRIVRDAGSACDFAESEITQAYFTNQGNRGLQQRLAKILVMVGL